MKLLYILPEYLPHSGGGIITHYRMLLPKLAALGHEVKVLVGSGVCSAPAAPAVEIEGVTVETLDHALFARQLPRFGHYGAMPGLRNHLAAAWALHEQARAGEGFDVVETTDWGLLFLPWVVEAGPPIVVQCHGSCGQIDVHDPVAGEEAQGQMIRLLELTGLPCANAVQTYSPANADFWRGQMGCPVDYLPPAWQPLGDSESRALRSGPGLVVGRVQRWKGPQVLCEALRLLGDRAPAMHWVGRDTSYERRGRTTGSYLAEAFPDIWNRRLLHQTQSPPERTAELQAKAPFIVVPSTWDMFNFTAVEAMGAGTPVICSTGAGACHLIEDGTTGLLFENGDPSSLAAALDRFLRMSEPERSDMGEAGRRAILLTLDPDRVAVQRLAALSDLAGRTRTPLPTGNWLRHACDPKDNADGGLAFLDHLPLRKLAPYVLKRSLRKHFT